jgi:hypothetical protein
MKSSEFERDIITGKEDRQMTNEKSVDALSGVRAKRVLADTASNDHVSLIYSSGSRVRLIGFHEKG